jgi:hypothetical protein
LNFRLQEDSFSFQQIQLMVENKELSKVAAAFSRFLAALRIRIRIKSGQWIRIRIQEDSFSFHQIQLMVEKKEFSKVAAAFSRFLAGFRIRIGSGSNRVSGSGSRRAKSRRKLRKFMF